MSKKGTQTPAENEEVENEVVNTEVENENETPAEGENAEGEEESEEEGEEGGEGKAKPKEGEAGFVPNFKYKVMDQEKEIDERLKTIVKTKEDEDFVRDLLTKADGLEAVNSKHKKLEEKHIELENDYSTHVVPYVREVENVKKLIAAPNFEQRDYDSFFQKLGIPKDHILKYTKSILDYQDATPEQRAAIDNQRNLRMQAQQHEEQSQFFQSQNQQFAVQARTFELNQELTKPEVNSFVTSFDSLHGNGAFRNQVIQQGALIFHNQKRDVAPSELVRLVMDQFKGIQTVAPQVIPNANNPANQNPATITKPAPTKKPILPNVQGNGGSPAKKVFTSLDEIKAHRKKLKNA